MTTVPHLFKPSHARVVVLDDFLPIPRGAALPTPPALSWPAKDPGDVLDYQLDLSPALIGNEGDGITGIDVVITPNGPGDLALTASAADGASAVLWLAGGQAGSTYNVSVTVTTASGRAVARNIFLPVRPLSAPAATNAPLQDDAGAGLTDENGNPLLLI